jgi:hypothetical protein
MGPAERWLRETKPTPTIGQLAVPPENAVAAKLLLLMALDRRDEWSFFIAERNGLLGDIWQEAIKEAEELGL